MRSVFRLLVRGLLALLALCVLLVGGFIAWNWAPDRPVEELAARWGAPPSQFETVLGLPIHLRDEGPRDDSMPILLLHGTGDSLHTWQGWADALVPTRRVIRYDLPGFGLTGPDPTHDYSMKRQVAVLMAVLDRLGVERAVIAGNSLGGGIAWQAALAHPERVSALVLVDASGAPAADVVAAASAAPRSVPIGFRLARMSWAAPVLQRVLPRDARRQPRCSDVTFRQARRARQHEAGIGDHAADLDPLGSTRPPDSIGRRRTIPRGNFRQRARGVRRARPCAT